MEMKVFVFWQQPCLEILHLIFLDIFPRQTSPVIGTVRSEKQAALLRTFPLLLGNSVDEKMHQRYVCQNVLIVTAD